MIFQTKKRSLWDWIYDRLNVKDSIQEIMRKQRKGEIGYILKLFISGATTNSTRAITNLQKILETYLQGKYTLNIIDVRQETSVAKEEQIIALPLLIVKKPLPERRLIGDMSNTEKVLKGLGITSSEDEK